MSFNFSSLDLTDADIESGRKSLEAGEHNCKISSVEIKDTRNGGKMMVVELKGGGGQVVYDRINVVNKNPEAVKIGHSRLKHLLEMAGHPNPNRPQDINTIKGLSVGIHVVIGDDWTDDEGMIRKGGGQPRQSAPYFKSNEVTPAVASGSSFSDDIPF